MVPSVDQKIEALHSSLQGHVTRIIREYSYSLKRDLESVAKEMLLHNLGSGIRKYVHGERVVLTTVPITQELEFGFKITEDWRIS